VISLDPDLDHTRIELQRIRPEKCVFQRRKLSTPISTLLAAEFQESGKLFIGAHDVTLSVAAMRVSNSDCAPVAAHGRDATPTPSGFAEIVGDGFPVLHHLELCSLYCLLFNTSPNDSEQHDGNDSSHSQEGFMESKLTQDRRLCRAGCVFPL